MARPDDEPDWPHDGDPLPDELDPVTRKPKRRFHGFRY
jgi:hypothetical protein